LIVDAGFSRHGVEGIRLEGELVVLTIFPDAGGKILDLVHRPSGKNLLWQNPRVRLARTHAGARFDDVWCGGWDDLFPTDAPCTIDGNVYHDHGDLWIGPWDWEIEEDTGARATVRLCRYSASLPCLMEKWVTLRRDEPVVTLRQRVTNLGPRPVRFVWDVHVAHAVEPGSRVYLPTSSLKVEPPYLGRAGRNAAACSWPLHIDESGVEHDLSRTPPASDLSEFFWADGLGEGWCATVHPSVGVGLGLAFDPAVFPAVLLFGDYGGWRGHYFLLTEPCTSPPGSLADAVESGSAAMVAAGEALETDIVATVLEGADGGGPAGERPPRLVSVEDARSRG
jgi:hypothetical protein